MLLVFVCISLLCYWIIVQHRKKINLNSKLKHFPGTNLEYPILGDVHMWSITKWSIHDKIKHFLEVIRDYPTTLKVWFGSKVVIVINNPVDIKILLLSPDCIDKSNLYHKTIGGEGLFVANGNEWRNQRRHLNSAFSSRVIKSYENEINQFGRNIVAALEVHAVSGKEFDITPLLGNNLTELFLRTIYGSTRHKFELAKRCYEMVDRLMVLWGERMLQIYFHIIKIVFRKIFGISSKDKILNKQLRTNLQPIFDQKIEEYHNNVVYNKNYINNSDVKDEYFLEKITRLHFEGIIGLKQYRHTSMNMFLAGTETTVRSISLLTLMLAIHEEYQRQIFDEINNCVEVNGHNNLDISKLNLLDRFIKETFRLFPVVPLLGRKPTHDIAITEGIIPADTDILIPIENIHKHPSIWGKDASKFNPDNFLSEAVAKRDKCSYIPFSYGPRNCIGYKFAQFALHIGIIYLLKNYQFKTTLKMEDIKIGYGLTSSLLNDNLVSVRPRNFVVK